MQLARMPSRPWYALVSRVSMCSAPLAMPYGVPVEPPPAPGIAPPFTGCCPVAVGLIEKLYPPARHQQDLGREPPRRIVEPAATSDAERFIFLWIAFNAAYGKEVMTLDVGDRPRERENFESFLRQIVSRDGERSARSCAVHLLVIGAPRSECIPKSAAVRTRFEPSGLDDRSRAAPGRGWYWRPYWSPQRRLKRSYPTLCDPMRADGYIVPGPRARA